MLTCSRRRGKPGLLLGFLLEFGSASRSEVEKQLSVVGRKENRHHCLFLLMITWPAWADMAHPLAGGARVSMPWLFLTFV